MIPVKQDSPSPEPTPEPPSVPPPSMATADPIRRQSVPMAPTSTAFHPGVPVPIPSPSPAHAHAHANHYQQPHFIPPRPVATTPSAIPVQSTHHQYQHHTAPSPVHHHAPAHSPHFAPQHQGYSHHPQQQPPPPHQQQPHYVPSPASVGHHHHIPNAGSFSSQPHVPYAAPVQHHHSRMPMAPTASNTAIPHANANATMHTGAPRYDSWVLYDDVDASIPREVRDQYHTDDKGHLLFFTAPPQNRPSHGAAEENATLGHSVRYLSDIHEHRAERERKRKERDEALRQQAADQAARDKEVREQTERQMSATAGQRFGDWILGMQRENEEMEKELAPIRAQKAAWLAEKDALNGKQQQE